MSVWYITESSVWLTFLAFLGIQLQGTLYNYYYVILRTNTEGGDATSKITETSSPTAFPGENQQMVTVLYHIYNVLYILFDKAIYYADPKAVICTALPNWFMTLVSFYGLGAQLLLMALFLVLNGIDYILPFFIGYSVFILLLIVLRRNLPATAE